MQIRKHIPNSITALNLLCGSVGTVLALQGNPRAAFIFMILGGIADFCDGFAARLLKAGSPIGKELDSLADQVTFGLLPSVLLFGLISDKGQWWCWTPLLIAVFSGLRLAKFNLDERQTSSFLGLPTPACALVCGGAACFVASTGAESGQFAQSIAGFLGNPATVCCASILLSLLLVSEIPMFSMKIHKGDSIGCPRICFAICAAAGLAATAILGFNWSFAITFAFTAYIIINIADALWQRKRH